MKTNATFQSDEGARVQSEQLGTQRKWLLFVGQELCGILHARTEAEALDRVAKFQRPFRVELAMAQ
jgi:hypothetical protein